MIFYLLRIKIHFHINGFTLCLVLKQGLGATREWPIDLLINTSQTITVSIYFAYTSQKDTHTKINAGAWSQVRADKIAISVCSVKQHCQKYHFVHGLDHRVLDCRSGPGCSNVG